MKTIHLNHRLHTSAPKPLASFLLCVAVLAVLLSLFFLQQSNARLTELKQEKARYTRTTDSKSTAQPLSEREQAELDAVNVAINEIVRPWSQLFFALEESRLDSINLVAIEPNAKTNTVQIIAITSPVDEILAYIDELKKQAMVSSVSLLSTESVRLDGKEATQFELLVTWVEH